MVPHIPLIQPEHEFIDIAAHMLLAPVMVDAVESPLRERPDVLYAVRVCHVVHELFGTVFDRLVLVQFLQTHMRAEFVRVFFLYIMFVLG